MLHPRRSWLHLAQLSFSMSSASCQGGQPYQQAAPTQAGTCICDDHHRICVAGVVAHSRASSAGAPPPQSCRLSRGAQADRWTAERLCSRPASRRPMMHGMDIWPSQAVGPKAAGRARILALPLEVSPGGLPSTCMFKEEAPAGTDRLADLLACLLAGMLCR